MKHSVIVPTRDRAESLDRSLCSIEREIRRFGKPVQVVVVDNGSSDQTASVARRPGIDYQFEPEPGLHNARHRGLQAADGDLLTFVDDDIEALPGWLDAIQESAGEDGVVLVGGRNLPRFEETPPDWVLDLWNRKVGPGRCLPYLSILDFGDMPRRIAPEYVWGCNFSIKRSVLEEAGGFHPDVMPKDLIRYWGDGESWISEFVTQRGYGAAYNPGASIHHVVPAERLTRDYFRWRAYNQGVSDSYTILRYLHRRSQPGSGAVGIARASRVYKLILAQLVKRVLGRGPRLSARGRLDADLFRANDEGFRFHHRAAREDRELLQWVLKPTYLPVPARPVLSL